MLLALPDELILLVCALLCESSPTDATALVLVCGHLQHSIVDILSAGDRSAPRRGHWRLPEKERRMSERAWYAWRAIILARVNIFLNAAASGEAWQRGAARWLVRQAPSRHTRVVSRLASNWRLDAGVAYLVLQATLHAVARGRVNSIQKIMWQVWQVAGMDGIEDLYEVTDELYELLSMLGTACSTAPSVAALSDISASVTRMVTKIDMHQMLNLLDAVKSASERQGATFVGEQLMWLLLTRAVARSPGGKIAGYPAVDGHEEELAYVEEKYTGLLRYPELNTAITAAFARVRAQLPLRSSIETALVIELDVALADFDEAAPTAAAPGW